jgi:Xaa-Pro aminopeptidase
MQTMHPTLLIGAYDWDADRFPKAEFAERIATLWATLSPAVAGVLIYADPRHNAELAYYTNYIPRLEPALALIPRKGDPVMLPSDPPSMWSSAKRVTWIENFVPLRQADKALAEWRKGATGGSVTTFGFNAMPPALHRTVAIALGGIALPDATATAHTLMRRKRPRELQALREAAGILQKCAAALIVAQKNGASAAGAVLEAEHAGLKAGAQDVRILYSVDGGRTLRPFETLSDAKAEPLVAYIAVRHAGYWADGFVTAAAKPSALQAKVTEALRAMIGAAKAGASMVELASGQGFPLHAMTKSSIGAVLGLGLEDEPLSLTRAVATETSFGGAIGLGPKDSPASSRSEALVDGSVYALRVGASESGAHALASAIVLVREAGNEVLWTSP